MNPLTGLLELLHPERCVVCDRSTADAPPARLAAGPAPGLRRWDATHLCGDCQAGWAGHGVAGCVDGLPLRTATLASGDLVRAVGDWKYHGLRGLGRPLAALLVPLLAHDPEVGIVPVPLHVRRRRERGFDQCHQLAALVGRAADVPVLADILRRRRATAQQASCAVDGVDRRRNVAAAFSARPPRPHEPRRVVLLDDLVTTGATVAAAAEAATAAGWQVTSLVAVGQAARLATSPQG